MGKTVGVAGSLDESGQVHHELAPDGQRVVVTRMVQANVDVWLIDVNRNVSSRFTFDNAFDSAPLWSPDARQVVFRSSRKGVYDLFIKPTNGTADEQPLLVTPENKTPLDWSHDGRLLLYSTQNPNGASDIWALPMMGERKPFPILQSSFDEIAGQFSPDGRWLAYASNESGRYEVYVRTFPETGGNLQVSATGGAQPRWGPDGKELFYVAQDSRLMAVSIRPTGEARSLGAGAPVALFPTRLATGGNVPTSGGGARSQYAVARDGRFLLNITPDDAVASPITIVHNWAAGLKN